MGEWRRRSIPDSVIISWGWLGTNGQQEKLEGEVWQEVVRGGKWAI